jgi:hypothetical protein
MWSNKQALKTSCTIVTCNYVFFKSFLKVYFMIPNAFSTTNLSFLCLTLHMWSILIVGILFISCHKVLGCEEMCGLLNNPTRHTTHGLITLHTCAYYNVCNFTTIPKLKNVPFFLYAGSWAKKVIGMPC